MSRVEDEKWMNTCFELAVKGAGYVSPNPLVGAIIVLDGKLLGKGYHRKFGDSHAEVNAIQDAHARHPNLHGATLYVNLEPCVHYGKTPPCVNAIVNEGITKVVAAMKDPNPLVAGKGFAYLRNAGIKVVTGVLKSEAERINEKFIEVCYNGNTLCRIEGGPDQRRIHCEEGRHVEMDINRRIAEGCSYASFAI